MNLQWHIPAVVLLWWVANGITSIASKSMMVVRGNEASSGASFSSAFEDLRWLELTTLQHLFGAIASVILLKALKGKSAAVWPQSDSPKTTIYIAGLANVVGNLATNAAYSLVSSSATQVIKAYEPIFTFFLSLCLYKHYGDLTVTTLLSIVTMSTGACIFLSLDTSFNVWGLLAATSSNMGFATRNIFLKKLAWDSPVQKYAVISICSTVLLLPAILLKSAIVSVYSPLFTHSQESIISAVSHFTYNTASITILQDITPLTHAILNLSKRVFVIVANLIYFHIPVSTNLLLGLLIFFVGLTLYNLRKRHSVKQITAVVAFFAIVFCVGLQGRRIFYSQDSVNQQPMRSESISTAWIYDRPLTADILTNIERLVTIDASIEVHVYCGTSQCVRAVMERKHPSITSEFLVINNLVKDTPLEEWLTRHPLYKVLAGPEFEDHLQRVVQLGILWKYGGIYFDPRIKVTRENQILTDPTCHNGWISDHNHSNGDFDISCFPKHHPFIKLLVAQFSDHYPKQVPKRSKQTPEFVFDFKNVLNATISNFCNINTVLCPNSVAIPYEKQNQIESLSERHHFGTLSYELRAKKTRGGNLGDSIQSFSGVQFLPFIDNLLERDEMNRLKEKNPVTSFFNAWYGDIDADWPPPGNIDPIMTSIHIHENVENKWTRSVGYLKQHEPIGCRDLSTMEFLRSIDVKSYFSGCMTLMLKNPRLTKPRTNTIYVVDVKNKEYMDLFPPEIVKESSSLTHGHPEWAASNLKLFSAAYNLLEAYASAKLVITQRIHCALPCVALGTPVIFIQSPKLPGGEGSETQSSPRTHGLTPLFHTVDLYKMSLTEAKKWLSEFDWNNPPPNPNVQMLMRLRATFWNTIRQNQALYDAAYKFGMIPILPPPVKASAQVPHQLLFHLIFTESTLKWYHWRTVESIFYHHPFAEVVIHSNTLDQSEFNVLTEASYSINVQSYSITDMLKDSANEELTSKLSSAISRSNWQRHQIDLLRLLMLYKWGGIYMDNDVVVVNPLYSLRNILAWEDVNNQSLSGAFMAFERGSRFLSDCLVAFANHYSGSDLSTNGSDLLTNVWKERNNDAEVVAMPSALFYMFSKRDIKTECFSTSSLFDAKMKILKDKAYTVRVNPGDKEIDSKLTNGTICKHILNSFCVLCNKLY